MSATGSLSTMFTMMDSMYCLTDATSLPCNNIECKVQRSTIPASAVLGPHCEDAVKQHATQEWSFQAVLLNDVPRVCAVSRSNTSSNMSCREQASSVG